MIRASINAMKVIAATIYIAFAALAFGADVLVSGGKSPDGRFEVRVFRTDTPEPSGYFYGVVDTKSRKLIKQLSEGGGFASYEGVTKISSVFWHSSSRFFALTDHGTRHSVEMYIYEVIPDEVVLIKQPDYFQNALGRINATEGYTTSVVKPFGWNGDILRCELAFDAEVANHSRSPVYTTTFTLRLLHGPNQSPYLLFTSMSKPTEAEQ